MSLITGPNCRPATDAVNNPIIWQALPLSKICKGTLLAACVFIAYPEGSVLNISRVLFVYAVAGLVIYLRLFVLLSLPAPLNQYHFLPSKVVSCSAFEIFKTPGISFVDTLKLLLRYFIAVGSG